MYDLFLLEMRDPEMAIVEAHIISSSRQRPKFDLGLITLNEQMF